MVFLLKKIWTPFDDFLYVVHVINSEFLQPVIVPLVRYVYWVCLEYIPVPKAVYLAIINVSP